MTTTLQKKYLRTQTTIPTESEWRELQTWLLLLVVSLNPHTTLPSGQISCNGIVLWLRKMTFWSLFSISLSFQSLISCWPKATHLVAGAKLLFRRQFLRRNTTMNCHLATFLVTLALISLAKGFCGPRLLQTNLARSAFRAAEWLKTQQDENGTYGEGHVHAVILHSLRLIGFPVEHGAEHMKAEIIKNELGSIPGARIGSYILGAMSACHDPQNFFNFNLLRALKTKMGKYPRWGFEHPFQYSYAVMALCSTRASFGKRKVSYKDNIVDSIPQQLATVHSISSDTLAMQTLALSCLKNSMKRKGSNKTKIIAAIKKASDELNKRQMNDSTFGGNEVTAALAAQALLAAEVKKTKCAKTMRWLLSRQNPDGSFINKLSTIIVLPSLIGALPYDVQHIACPKNTSGSVGERKMIIVCVELLFEVNNLPNGVQESGPSSPPRACVEVVNGTKAHDILQEAANQHPCYNFTVSHTSYGRMIKSICNIEQKPAEKFYWVIDINGKPAPVGIDDLQPDDGSTLSFHYKQLNWG